jgi:hypothetical protein
MKVCHFLLSCLCMLPHLPACLPVGDLPLGVTRQPSYKSAQFAIASEDGTPAHAWQQVKA